MRRTILLDSFGRPRRIARVNDVVKVVTHGNEQVEEKFPTTLSIHVAAAALFHFGLHRAAALEGLAAADDECQIMGAQATVGVGRVSVAILRATKDDADVDTSLQPLLPQRQSLEFLQSVALCGAVDYRVAEQVLVQAGEKHGRLDGELTRAATSELW